MAINETLDPTFGQETNDNFMLYMFEDEVDEIERFIQDSNDPQGCLLGLWTNSRNPVVHVVQLKDIVNENYPFLKNYQSTLAEYRNADKIFTRIGHWYFSQTDEIGCTSQETRDLDQGFVYLKVTKTAEGDLNFLPQRFCKGEISIGSKEILAGRNPFKLSKHEGQREDEESSDNENIGVVARMVEHFEDLSKTSSGDCESQLRWYERDDGLMSLQQIHGLLEETTQSVEIKRDIQSLSLLLLFRLDSKQFRLDFPSKFPESGAILYQEIERNDPQCICNVKFNKPQEFVHEVINACKYRLS